MYKWKKQALMEKNNTNWLYYLTITTSTKQRTALCLKRLVCHLDNVLFTP